MSQTPLTRPPLPAALSALQKTLQQCVQVLEQGREADFYAFAWYEEKFTQAVEAKQTLTTSVTRDSGVVLRLMANAVQYEVATNALDADNLLAKATDLRRKVDALNPSMTAPAYAPLTWQQELLTPLPDDLMAQLPADLTPTTAVHFAPLCGQDPAQVELKQLIERAKDYRQQALTLAGQVQAEQSDYQPIADVRLMLRLRTTTTVFVDRSKSLSQILPVTVLAGAGFTAAGQSGRIALGGLGTLELIQFGATELNTLARTPQQLSVAERLRPGRYMVITGPALSGIIAHEAFGHTQEGDTWMKGRSIARTLRASGTRVGNDQASIVNNPALFSMEGQAAGSNGSYYFDNEGQLARAQTILDRGLLSTPMTDLTSALKLAVPRTANGKRESWRRPLMTRQTNTYFTPGDKSLDELIALVPEGYLAVAPNGGMEDPKGGSLTAGTGYFEEIRAGKLTGKLLIGPSGGHIELTDSVFDMLDNIQAKTDVQHPGRVPPTQLGGCGKYHKELVDAGVGGPYILWRSVACG